MKIDKKLMEKEDGGHRTCAPTGNMATRASVCVLGSAEVWMDRQNVGW